MPAPGTVQITTYNPATYTFRLNIDKNGGDTAPSNVSRSVTSNSASVSVSLNVPTALPTRAGYRFLGYAQADPNNGVSWQPGEGMSTSFSRTITSTRTVTYTDGDTTYIETIHTLQNKSFTRTLYAKWEKLTYAVTYNANGGTGAPAAQTKTHGTALTLSSVVPTRANHNFVGWATSPSGAAVYQPGGSYTANASVILYAVWELAGSTIDTITNPVEIGSSGSASWNILNPAYTYRLVISCGGAPSVTVDVPANTSSATFAIPSSWLNAITSAASATATATLTTYDGTTAMGSSSKPFTVTVPADIVPSISSFTAENYSTNATVMSWGEFVQGFSCADLEVEATAGTGATIASVAFSGPEISQAGEGTTARTGILSTSGTKTFTATVTDSRGRSASATVSVTVYPYSVPTVISIATMRADADGTTNNSSGAYLKVMPIYSLSSVNGNNSFVSESLAYGDHGSSTPTGSIPCQSGVTYGPPNNLWIINLSDAYDVAVNITDALGGTTTAYVTLPGADGLWYGRGNDRLGLGDAPPGPGFHCSWDAYFKGVVDIVNRRCSATLSSAGWYRVMKFDAGSTALVEGGLGAIVNFNITRRQGQSTNEVHGITLDFVRTPALAFVNENSKSGTLLIDKIRYNTAGTVGYIDIHYTGTTAEDVAVCFDVNTLPSYFSSFTAESLQSVADAPAGETVLTTYSFSTETVTDISSEFSINTNISGIVGYVAAIFDASTQTVDVSFSAYSSATIGTSITIASCTNSRYRPKSQSNGNGMIHNKTSGEWYPYKVGIDTSGNITQAQTGNADRVFGHIKYKV